MASDTPMLSPELLSRIGNLKIRARTVVEGVLTGLHKSPHHGSSIEFAEHKEYSPGDDIRHIDWKAYARMDRYYVKKFEDETNLRCYLLVDNSASMGYGEGSENKLEYARVLAAAFAYLLLRQQDAPGLTVFNSSVNTFIPPRGTSSHYQELLEALVRMQPQGTTDLAAAIGRTAETLHGRNLVVVISDFFDPEGDVQRVLARLRARKNDVVLFQVLHDHELNLPFDHLTQFEDLESDAMLLADPDAIRQEYRKVFGSFLDKLREGCLQAGIGYQQAISNQPHEQPLLAYLKKREGAP